MVASVVQEIARSIVQEVHPQRVILFGSRARGDAADRSDYDIAVEGKNIRFDQWDHLLEKMENQYLTLLPIDLVRLEEASPPLKKRILTEGIVLYDDRKA